MSERGSFVTEYVYCPKCFEVVMDVLSGHDKYLVSTVLPSWKRGESLPIVAGKLGGLNSEDEIYAMEELGEEMSVRLCHPVRVAVLADSGADRVFMFGPES